MKFIHYFFGIPLFFLFFSGFVLAQQTCKPESIASTTSHLIGKSDGTVVDGKNKLMWKICPEGFSYLSNNTCVSSGTTSYSWTNALKLPAAVNINGYPVGDSLPNYKNWRLPNIKELQSIIEEQCYNPAIKFTVFPASSISQIWSNSPSDLMSDNKKSWYINFLYGEMLDRLRGEFIGVRLVRDCTGTECD